MKKKELRLREFVEAIRSAPGTEAAERYVVSVLYDRDREYERMMFPKSKPLPLWKWWTNGGEGYDIPIYDVDVDNTKHVTVLLNNFVKAVFDELASYGDRDRADIEIIDAAAVRELLRRAFKAARNNARADIEAAAVDQGATTKSRKELEAQVRQRRQRWTDLLEALEYHNIRMRRGFQSERGQYVFKDRVLHRVT